MEENEAINGKAFISSSMLDYGVLFVIAAGLFVISAKIVVPYSYWIDELCSVTASNESFNSLYKIILSDVHPPLYQIILKLWIDCWGDGEVSTRSLSLLFAAGSIAPIVIFARSYGAGFRFVCVAVFCSNMLLAYYANEARSYTMALFFSSFVITGYLQGVSKQGVWRFLIPCLLLSLTHYFGLILVGTVLLYSLVDNYKNKQAVLRIVGAGALCLLWPLNHVMFGALLDQSGGGLWIKVNGVVDSIGIASSGFLARGERYGAYIFIIGLAFSLVFAVYSLVGSKCKNKTLASMAFRSVILLGTFVVVVAIADIYSPMSTRRNYIVLLPLVAVLAASVLCLICERWPIVKNPLLLGVFVFSLDMLRASYNAVAEKSVPQQDWKTAAQVVKQNSVGKNIYFTTSHSVDKKWRELNMNFYIRKISSGSIKAIGFLPGETEIMRPALVLSGHNHSDFKVLRTEMSKLGARQIFPSSDESRGYAATVWLIN